MFTFSNGTALPYIILTCVNAEGGGAPYWNPPFDYDVNPFPECKLQRECDPHLTAVCKVF
jgi:hypothetical protein